ncbi:MAG: glycosyltransferase family 2 protein [Tepidisphaeraceae bacterium]
MRLLIAIPTFNEARHLERVLGEVAPYCPDVLLVDDGSSDATPQILERYRDTVHVLRHPKNMGYGQSLIDAFAWADRAGFDWVITMDADGQHEAESIPDFIREIRTGEWDLISGSRYLAARNDDDLPPLERRHVNHRITTLMNNLFRMELTDSFCGFKAHRVASMIDLKLTEPGYAFPLQLWPRVYASKLRLKEIPVRRIYNDPNRSFGTHLDDADRRLKHYLTVLNAELRDLGMPEMTDAPVLPARQPVKHCCGCCK